MRPKQTAAAPTKPGIAQFEVGDRVRLRDLRIGVVRAKTGWDGAPDYTVYALAGNYVGMFKASQLRKA
jgi:hypothetical protein